MSIAEHKKQIVRDFYFKYCVKHTLTKCESKAVCTSCELIWYRNQLAKTRYALEISEQQIKELISKIE